MTIEEVLSFEEMQIFDRKSINIEPKALAIPLVAFANADGGTIAVGISDKTRRIEGVDFEVQKYNELLRVPFDFCNPTIPVQIEKVPCVDYQGRKNHVLLIHIEPSPQVHTNQADEAYLRVGDIAGGRQLVLLLEQPDSVCRIFAVYPVRNEMRQLALVRNAVEICLQFQDMLPFLFVCISHGMPP